MKFENGPLPPHAPTMIQRFLPVLALLLLAMSGCNQPTATGPEMTVPTNAAPATNRAAADGPRVLPYLDHAQPRLMTMKIFVGPEVLETELALRPLEISTGMMHRTEMGESEGMLFVFARPYRASFYMRNTKVPLSAAYIDPEGRIAEIHDLQPLEEQPVYANSDRIQYVLEVKQGWFERHKIPVGALVSTEVGSLADTFQMRK